MSVGVVGVGRIGTPLVARLLAAGHDVVATDTRADRRSAVEQAGAAWAPDAAEVAAATQTVLTVLPGGQELRELMLGSGQLVSSMGDGTIWVDLTSASFELGQEIAHHARALDVRHLGAPIGGSVPVMRAGAVTLYVGGERDVLQPCAPVLSSVAATVHHVGGPGTGYLAKLLINLLWSGHATLTAEALLLAQRHGMPPEHMRTMLHGSAGDSTLSPTTCRLCWTETTSTISDWTGASRNWSPSNTVPAAR